MRTIHNGDHGDDVKRLQTAVNRRLHARSAPGHMIKVDGVFGPKTRDALRFAFYLCGADQKMIDGVKTGGIGPNEQTWIMHPGKRTAAQKALGKKRVARHRAAVKKAAERAAAANAKRKKIVAAAKLAAANYRKNPGAYHYLAGGVANTIFLKPSPSNYRSDCSQFVSSVYKHADVPSPALPLDYLWAATTTIMKSPHVRVTRNPKPGDLGMYGPHDATHHVELFVGESGCKFIGHGSPPIDSLTPGEPDFYVTFDFLD